MIREFLAIAYYIAIIVLGVVKFKQYHRPAFILLVLISFFIIFITGAICHSKTVTSLAKKYPSLSYVCFAFCVLYAVFSILGSFFIKNELGTTGIKFMDYFIFFLLSFSSSSYNLGMFFKSKE